MSLVSSFSLNSNYGTHAKWFGSQKVGKVGKLHGIDWIEEMECNKFFVKTFRKFIIFKMCKIRNMSLPHMMDILKLGVCRVEKNWLANDCTGDSFTNTKCKFRFTFYRQAVPLLIIFVQLANILHLVLRMSFWMRSTKILEKTNLTVSVIILMKFCLISDC